MKENTNLPASIRQRLELAQQYADRGQYNQADNVLQEMARSLASSAPELCALLMAGQMGYQGFDHTQSEQDVRTRRVEKRMMGVKYGEDVETTTTTRTTTVRYRLVK